MTVVLLVGVTLTGLTRRMRLHLPLVGAAVASLGGAIFFAVQLGELYDLEAAGLITPIHLGLAKLTTALYLAPLLTGLATLRARGPARERLRPWHRAAAFLVLGLTVVTTVTGAWMILASTPLQ